MTDREKAIAAAHKAAAAAYYSPEKAVNVDQVCEIFLDAYEAAMRSQGWIWVNPRAMDDTPPLAVKETGLTPLKGVGEDWGRTISDETKQALDAIDKQTLVKP